MVTAHTSLVVVIDVQSSLAGVMYEQEHLISSLGKLIDGAQVLGVPLIWTEQNPARLGPTVPGIASRMHNVKPISKMSFSCCGCDEFMQQITALGRSNVFLCGIESHICVYQTAAELAYQGYSVHVVADCVSSRTAANRDIGLRKACDAGAAITSVETLLFEMLGTAAAPQFKEIARIIR
jgi:nicotinamidase-related amidase